VGAHGSSPCAGAAGGGGASTADAPHYSGVHMEATDRAVPPSRSEDVMEGIMRLRAVGEGQRGFCFGVDSETWAPPTTRQLVALALDTSAPAGPLSHTPRPLGLTPSMTAVDAEAAKRRADMSKRLKFCQTMDWSRLGALICSAGLLTADSGSGVQVDVGRMAAMLTLTAIHDVMKLAHLLPVVLPEHAPFCGHKAGDVIRDHDMALGYVMLHDAAALPSFSALPAELQTVVRFTQADLGFNHGWLVQAEAPPGILFRTFKRRVDDGGIASADIAFYFVHWLTDLAGAEPSPLRGSEKFVVRFPQPVLEGIIRSMPVVQELAHSSPTALYERYLEQVWRDAKHLGPLPVGPEAIALMRAVVQVQEEGKQRAIAGAFGALDPELRATLGVEMGLTCQPGATYSRAPDLRGGPAFLVYYSPAFLRSCCAGSDVAGAHMGLAALSEVYAAARRLWPRTATGEADGVTVYVDELKACAGLDELHGVYAEGGCWLLLRENDTTAVVRRCPLDKLPAKLAQGSCEMLRLWASALRPSAAKEKDGLKSVSI